MEVLKEGNLDLAIAINLKWEAYGRIDNNKRR